MWSRLPGDHPIWPLLHTVVATCCFGLLLAVTATTFDATEMKAIGGGGLGTLAFNYLFKPKGGQ